MRTYLIISLFLFAPLAVFAAYNDVSVSGSSVITVGGINLTVSGTASFDSITVDSSSFSINLSKNAQLIVTSADRRTFKVSPSQYQQGFTCGSSVSTLTVGNNLWDTTVTVTVTPSSSICSSGGGGASGGGGGYSAPAVPPQVAIAPTTPAVSQITKLSPVAIGVSPVFAKTLSFGVASNDIKRFQQILNADPDTKVAASGAGSPGKETTYFGSLTRTALQKFQCKYKVVCSGTPTTTGYGNLGPKTRAKIQELFK